MNETNRSKLEQSILDEARALKEVLGEKSTEIALAKSARKEQKEAEEARDQAEIDLLNARCDYHQLQLQLAVRKRMVKNFTALADESFQTLGQLRQLGPMVVEHYNNQQQILNFAYEFLNAHQKAVDELTRARDAAKQALDAAQNEYNQASAVEITASREVRWTTGIANCSRESR